MNPAALKANLGDLPRGADIIVNTDEFTKRNLTKVGYAANPLEDGSLEAYNVHPIALTSMTVEALKGFDITKKEAERAKNMFALGLLSWLYHRPDRGHRDVPRGQVRHATPEIMQANITAFEAGWTFGETTEDFSVSYEVKPAQLPTGHLPQHLRQPRPVLRPGRRLAAHRAAAVPRAPTRSRRPRDILHELSKHKRFGVRTFQAEDEIAGVGAALGAAFGGSLGVTDDVRPGARAQGRDDRARRVARAAADRRRRPARRAVDRACRPRPSRPTCCRRCSAATARRRCRSWRRARPADCFDTALEAARIATDVPHAGDPALRRLPGQRLRAVADPDRRRPARPAGRVRDRAQPRRSTTAAESSGPTCATRRRWPGRGRCRARPGSSTGSAASRRPTAPATSPTTRPTTTSWSAPGRPRSTAIAATIPPLEVEDPSRATPGCSCSAGARRTARSARPAGGCAHAGMRGRPGPPAPPQPVPGRTRRGAAPLRQGAVPEMNLGTASALLHAGAPSTSSTPSATTRCAACRSRRGARRPSSRNVIEDLSVTAPADARFPSLSLVPKARREADGQGLQDRPGGPLVPGLR